MMMKKNRFVRKSEFWSYYLDQDDNYRILEMGGVLSLEEKKYLFRKYVDVVNIETSSYCNRKCKYCPVSKETSRSLNARMTEEMFDSIVGELKEIGFKKQIALSMYNEPLFDDRIVSHIKKIRSNLEDTYIVLNTNGDKLTENNLKQLLSNGLNQILITLHPNRNQEYDDEERQYALLQFLKRMKLEEYYDLRSVKKNRNITIDIQGEDTRILITCNNWERYGVDRGGAIDYLSITQRTSPCNEPFRNVCIAYDGKYKPCCDAYFAKAVDYGTIYDTNILDFYFGKKMTDLRRRCFLFDEKIGFCKGCNREDNSSIETVNKRTMLLEMTKG